MEKIKAIAVEKRKRIAKQRRDTVLTRIDRHLNNMVRDAARARGIYMSRFNDEAMRFYFEHMKSNI